MIPIVVARAKTSYFGNKPSIDATPDPIPRRTDVCYVMSDDGYVDTVDGVAAITRDAARRLADRLFYLGFLALPWLWVLNAWTFAPHVFASPDAKGVDPHVARRAKASMWLGATAHVLLFAWALTFFLGGERVVGVAVWERFSATTQEL